LHLLERAAEFINDLGDNARGMLDQAICRLEKAFFSKASYFVDLV